MHTCTARYLKLKRIFICAVLSFVISIGSNSAPKSAENHAWKDIEFPGITPSKFVHAADEHIDIISEKSSSMLYRAVRNDERARIFLGWNWRVDTAPPATDLTQRESDRAIAIHLCFKGKPSMVLFRWMEQIFHPGIERFLQDHRCLTYVWGGKMYSGATFPDPYLKERGMVIVLRGVETPTGEWFQEKINYAKDYQAAFNKLAPKLSFLAISADSDATQSRAVSSISKIKFTEK